MDFATFAISSISIIERVASGNLANWIIAGATVVMVWQTQVSKKTNTLTERALNIDLNFRLYEGRKRTADQISKYINKYKIEYRNELLASLRNEADYYAFLNNVDYARHIFKKETYEAINVYKQAIIRWREIEGDNNFKSDMLFARMKNQAIYGKSKEDKDFWERNEKLREEQRKLEKFIAGFNRNIFDIYFNYKDFDKPYLIS